MSDYYTLGVAVPNANIFVGEIYARVCEIDRSLKPGGGNIYTHHERIASSYNCEIERVNTDTNCVYLKVRSDISAYTPFERVLIKV